MARDVLSAIAAFVGLTASEPPRGVERRDWYPGKTKAQKRRRKAAKAARAARKRNR